MGKKVNKVKIVIAYENNSIITTRRFNDKGLSYECFEVAKNLTNDGDGIKFVAIADIEDRFIECLSKSDFIFKYFNKYACNNA